MATILFCVFLGLMIGVLGGLIGIGGGVAVVPVLIYAFGMTQHQAQGTSLAMLLPPIGLLAAWTYYQAGYADIKIAMSMAFGFFIGGLIGAKVATSLSGAALRRVFGVFMLIVSLNMIFGEARGRAVQKNDTSVVAKAAR